jgi:hypothetical protein
MIRMPAFGKSENAFGFFLGSSVVCWIEVGTCAALLADRVTLTSTARAQMALLYE